MQRAGTSTAEAWAEFFRAQRHALTTYALSLAGNATDAQDLIQEVLVRMVQEDRPARDARAYVLRALRNEVIDRRRRRERRPSEAPLKDDGLAFVDVEAARQREGLEQVRAALAALGAEQREIIVLKIYAELTFREIAEILGCPLGTVTSRYARGLDELRALLRGELQHVS